VEMISAQIHHQNCPTKHETDQRLHLHLGKTKCIRTLRKWTIPCLPSRNNTFRPQCITSLLAPCWQR
jgi:hypothetical protein